MQGHCREGGHSPWTPATAASFPLTLLKLCPEFVAHAGDKGFRKSASYLPYLSLSVQGGCALSQRDSPRCLEEAWGLCVIQGPMQPTPGGLTWSCTCTVPRERPLLFPGGGPMIAVIFKVKTAGIKQ